LVSIGSQYRGDIRGAVLAKKRYVGVTQAGQDLGRVTFADVAEVFSESHLADVKRTVIDSPVAAIPRQEACGVGLLARNAGDGIGNLALLFVAPPLPAF
jgi:hypothetical protein